mmetsp:Transcript_25820/g.54844  ORF Transcript_25820/g.54844 Transcript_25820/m.54844 type:complete len:108 (+) Transcript_25820:60-383(+)
MHNKVNNTHAMTKKGSDTQESMEKIPRLNMKELANLCNWWSYCMAPPSQIQRYQQYGCSDMLTSCCIKCKKLRRGNELSKLTSCKIPEQTSGFPKTCVRSDLSITPS